MGRTPGFATADGTQRYARRFPHAAADHFRQRYGLWMSSIGLGTQLGAPTAPVSQGYVASMVAALAAGCNVIDTAPTYRLGRAEGDVGMALAQAFAQGTVQRDEVMVCTKGGYIPHDWPAESMPGDVVAGLHSLDPDFLAAQISASQAALGLETLDVFYLHSPDIRLVHENHGLFMQAIQRAFEGMEAAVSAGAIRFYGVAATEGFLVNPDAVNYLPLYKLVQVAEAVAGANHRFRFIQFPYSMGQDAGLANKNQPVRFRDGDAVRRGDMPVLAAAVQLGITAVTCGGLAHGLLADEIPEGVGTEMGPAYGQDPGAAAHSGPGGSSFQSQHAGPHHHPGQHGESGSCGRESGPFPRRSLETGSLPQLLGCAEVGRTMMKGRIQTQNGDQQVLVPVFFSINLPGSF